MQGASCSLVRSLLREAFQVVDEAFHLAQLKEHIFGFKDGHHELVYIGANAFRTFLPVRATAKS